ncbi:sulfurtransferase [Nonomuraea mesophila]|uniref:Sulfurtransferase n=2 Tax=Nonomuraea mesophila TaxID=2530382 RepID=A0A4R5F9K7_9ACTN|nr:sulfurtransferase [Nonomuraea mesophila]
MGEHVEVLRPLTVDGMLAVARAGLLRMSPAEAAAAIAGGARLVDTRPQFQRAADGEIPGAIVIERNHLEWRLDPTSPARIPEATGHDIAWILICDEGYSSSLAAASLRTIGLARATDVIGGFRAWKQAGLPLTHPATPATPATPRLPTG